MSHYRYKYDDDNGDFTTNYPTNLRMNPNQIGMYVEESHDAAVTGANFFIDLDNYPATEIHGDFVIPEFADPHTAFGSWADACAYGIVYAYNNTRITYLTEATDFVSISGKMVTFNNTNVANGDTITIGYYAIGVGYKDFAGDKNPDDIMLNPNYSAANSQSITTEQIQCLVRAMDTKSPIHLPKLGYKWAHLFAVKTETDNYSKTVLDTSATVGDGVPDYIVDYDTYFPFFVTETRVISEHDSLKVSICLQDNAIAGTDITDKGNTYIDFANTTLCYRTSSSSLLFSVSIPLGLCQTKRFRVVAISTGVGKARYELSAWYRPKVASHMVR